MPYDYSSAPPPLDFAELIPAGTLASVLMRIRPGGAGEDGMLKRSKEGDCEMLDCEFVLIDGPYARRKFWGNLVLEGTTAGHAQAAEISRGVLRGILESARNIRPDDLSDQARARRMASLKDFDNISFVARIGVEKGGPKKDGTGEIRPTRTSSPASSRRIRRNGIRSSSRRRSTAAMPARPRRLPRPQRLLRASRNRRGLADRHDPTDAQGWAGRRVRDRGRVAAASNRRRHCCGAWGRQT